MWPSTWSSTYVKTRRIQEFLLVPLKKCIALSRVRFNLALSHTGSGQQMGLQIGLDVPQQVAPARSVFAGYGLMLMAVVLGR